MGGPSPSRAWTFVILSPSTLGTIIRRIATLAQTDATSAEIRRWRRCQPTVPVRLTIEKSGHLNVINTWGFQINDGGFAVLAITELRIGDEAEFKFMPPHFYPFVTLRGIIRNRVDDVYGVEFLATGVVEKRQLNLFRQILARWDA